MPELPEVEYVARQLRADLVGHTITGAEVRWVRAVQGIEPPMFVAKITGRTVVDVGRRGKYLLIALDDGQTLVVHRRMSGNVTFAPGPDAELYMRVGLTLDDGRWLLYTDPRKFGRLALTAPGALDEAFPSLGPEPLDDAFTPGVLAERLVGRRTPIKCALLDQSVVAGLGNIYADEALFRAGIHPLWPAGALERCQVRALCDAIRETLLLGIEHGGTTFGRHRDAYNEAGRNVDHLQVYRRTGHPCRRCGAPIERITVAQRGTHFCPSCQQPRRGQAFGVVGARDMRPRRGVAAT